MAAEKLGVSVDQVIVIGDYVYDMEAGRRAGAVTVLLKTDSSANPAEIDSDFVIAHLGEVKEIIHLGLPLPQGKLPNGLLDRFLDHLYIKDPSFAHRPGRG